MRKDKQTEMFKKRIIKNVFLSSEYEVAKHATLPLIQNLLHAQGRKLLLIRFTERRRID